MNHRETVQTIARHLPHVERHTVAEVLEVAGEIWAQELAKPGGSVTLVNLGVLHVEIQDRPMTRMYFRFRPKGWLKEKVKDGTQEE
jgi:nucleoid DNA-binding protein